MLVVVSPTVVNDLAGNVGGLHLHEDVARRRAGAAYDEVHIVPRFETRRFPFSKSPARLGKKIRCHGLGKPGEKAAEEPVVMGVLRVWWSFGRTEDVLITSLRNP
jgi:hypothetical protein